MTDVPEIEISSVSDLLDLVEKIGMSVDFVYRGQKHSYTHLTTSIERHLDTETSRKYKSEHSSPLDFGSLPFIEHQIFKAFRQGVHHYAERPPEKDFLQWLALMQHHGAPTRLLDVTRSIFVALYFAVAHDDDAHGALYSFFDVDFFHFQKQSGELEPPQVRANRYLESLSTIWPSQQKQGKFSPGVINVKPQALNKRQIAQQGEFLMPIRVDQSFESNLASTHKLDDDSVPEFDFGDERVPGPKKPIIKYIIPRSIFAKVRITLVHMNITAASLFPDLDGYSRSMHEIPQRWRD